VEDSAIGGEFMPGLDSAIASCAAWVYSSRLHLLKAVLCLSAASDRVLGGLFLFY
jgi:hypothetical protein